MDALSSLSEGGAGDTIAERLQQQYEQAQQAGKTMTAVQQRQQRRKDYMEAAKQVGLHGGRRDELIAFIMLPVMLSDNRQQWCQSHSSSDSSRAFSLVAPVLVSCRLCTHQSTAGFSAVHHTGQLLLRPSPELPSAAPVGRRVPAAQ
jgi:hypothetical protein